MRNLSSIRVADFVVALALKTNSSILAYIGYRFDIPCEDVGRVMRLCISGFELFIAGRENAMLLLDQVIKVRQSRGPRPYWCYVFALRDGKHGGYDEDKSIQSSFQLRNEMRSMQ